ncbi:MAG TPA: c-type cytochrome [Terracidiphilus sp.]|nr:c-type cytochrome [Terracidiphilus sp.]
MAARRIDFRVLCGLLFAIGAQCHAQGQNKVDLKEAQRFVEYCAGCHGADGKGGDKGVSLATSQSLAARTDAELFQIIHDGTNEGMPPYAQIGTANIRSLVHYLRVLEGEPGPGGSPAEPSIPGDAEIGRGLYFGKARCSSCHMIDGDGGFIAADLTRYGRNRTAEAIAQAITTPDNPLTPSSRVVNVTTRSGQTFTGALRNEDNFNLEIQTEDGRYHLLARSELAQMRYTEHSLMPRDYGTRLTPKELNDIASFLMVVSKAPRTNPEQSR